MEDTNMKKREIALANMKAAGYHSDSKAYMRLIVESRVNRAAMNKAWEIGTILKGNGVKCECFECRKETA